MRMRPSGTCLVLGLSVLAAVAWSSDVPSTQDYCTAANIRALSPQQVRSNPPVRLRGVVTYARHSAITDYTIQDGTGGVWLLPTQLPENCRVGAEVEVEGHVEA